MEWIVITQQCGNVSGGITPTRCKSIRIIPDEIIHFIDLGNTLAVPLTNLTWVKLKAPNAFSLLQSNQVSMLLLVS